MRRAFALFYFAIALPFVALSFLASCRTPPPPRASSIALQQEAYIEEQSESEELLSQKDWVGKGRLPWGLEIRWPTSEPVITDYFGWRKKGRRRERLHDGVDLKAPKNTEIFAAAKGKVIYASRKIRNYGKMVVLDHGNAWSTVYSHLNEYKVKVGDEVNLGEIIGLSGKTGRASGPHLHFEIRRGSDPLDPLLFLPRVASTKSIEND